MFVHCLPFGGFMKRRVLLFITGLLFLGCSRLDDLKWDGMSSEKWLDTHSYWSVKLGGLDFILAEPSSTIIVYGLGFVILIIGIWFLKNKGDDKSRLLWGLGSVLWALSTFFAGTSYQAFSYEIKCSGNDICLWTSWWEIWYLLTYVYSMNLLTAAVAFSSSKGKLRKGVIYYTVINSLLYTIILMTGAFSPDKFLVSFECMVLFSSPMFIILMVVNILHYRKTKNKMDLFFILAWVLMFIIVILYFGYFMSGVSGLLWSKGIWFNANDVLHVCLILWILYIYKFLGNKIKDA